MWPKRLSAAVLAGLLWIGNVHAASLQGSEWKPLRMGSMAVPEASSAFVQFRSKGRLEGHSGCNRMFAEYEADDGHIFVGPVAATRMACEESLMATEAALAAALEDARTYRRMRTSLVLFDHDGNPILEMRQTDWD
jgi:heat shock protein HslJ